jgi:hypothetical protein
MAITSEINEQAKKKNNPYPKLRRSWETGAIILFSSETTGVVVGRGDLGYFSSEWAEYYFEDFDGSVTLENE